MLHVQIILFYAFLHICSSFWQSFQISSKSLITILIWAKLEVYPQKHILEHHQNNFWKVISHT